MIVGVTVPSDGEIQESLRREMSTVRCAHSTHTRQQICTEPSPSQLCTQHANLQPQLSKSDLKFQPKSHVCSLEAGENPSMNDNLSKNISVLGQSQTSRNILCTTRKSTRECKILSKRQLSLNSKLK